jgi:hypothetical protein
MLKMREKKLQNEVKEKRKAQNRYIKMMAILTHGSVKPAVKWPPRTPVSKNFAPTPARTSHS